MAHAMTRTADAMTGIAFVARVPSRPAPTVRTYRRRRLAVLLAAIATFLVAPVAASRAVAAFRDVPASVPERRPAPATAPEALTGGYLVQPGDTLWSIARRLQPEGDVRALVHQLVAANGGAELRVGQGLVLP
jgi:nucleoid-associated protein YgaU